MSASVARALFALIFLGCTAAPPVPSPVPSAPFREVDGSFVYDAWPAAARRHQLGSGAKALLPGFVDELVVAGLSMPTALRQMPDGSWLIAEQRGVVAHIASDGSRSDVIDLRGEVFNHIQLGMLGLAIDPDYPAQPYIYAAYTRDAPTGGSTPTYGGATDLDECPALNSCPASARVIRLAVAGSPPRADGAVQVLLDDWCASARNHTIGTLLFGRDGALYAGGGDGADGARLDYGQLATPPNSCADPPTDPGMPLELPDAEGGSLRSQDLRLGTDPVSLDGTIVRVDRATGLGLPDNPLADSDDANAQRIVGFGMRNPYRFTLRPGTDELWIADVGWISWEEINRVIDPVGKEPFNLGWPCFEGPVAQAEWSQAGLEGCAELYADPTRVTPPAFSFRHEPSDVHPCRAGAFALSALTFYDGAAFPEAYRGALLFADHPQGCVFAMNAGPDGLPDPASVHVFASRLRAVDMVVGTDGALYYVNLVDGELRRIAWRG